MTWIKDARTKCGCLEKHAEYGLDYQDNGFAINGCCGCSYSIYDFGFCPYCGIKLELDKVKK